LCVLLYLIENDVTERLVYRMFFLGRNFVSSLISTLKSKKNIKELKSKKLFPKTWVGFFQP